MTGDGCHQRNQQNPSIVGRQQQNPSSSSPATISVAANSACQHLLRQRQTHPSPSTTAARTYLPKFVLLPLPLPLPKLCHCCCQQPSPLPQASAMAAGEPIEPLVIIISGSNKATGCTLSPSARNPLLLSNKSPPTMFSIPFTLSAASVTNTQIAATAHRSISAIHHHAIRHRNFSDEFRSCVQLPAYSTQVRELTHKHTYAT